MNQYESIKQTLIKNPKKWLVTGVAGFIGSNLLEALLNLNQTVTGLDNFSTGYQHNLRRFNKSAKMTGLQPCCGILGSEPAKDEQGGKKRAIRKIKRYRNAHKFVIRQYESTGYDFDDGNCRGEKLIVTQAEQASVWI